MTYILPKKALELSNNIDVFSRIIVGCSIHSRMQDKLLMDCFLQACWKAHPHPGLIVHIDQGSQYDNAMMESFFMTLKRELINDAHFETRAEATQEIFKYIETYYNTKRMHSALDYKAPKDFEKYNS